MKAKRFIIWDPRDGGPRRDEDGEIISDGLIGRVGTDNVYIKVYASYTSEPRIWDLEVGQHTPGVIFNLSGQRGVYDVYRVA